jgi:hypothetical protein
MYASNYGRFDTPDPYTASGAPNDPGSWNRYAYTQGDPVNGRDRKGLFVEPVDAGGDDGDDDDPGEGCGMVDPVTQNYYSCGIGGASYFYAGWPQTQRVYTGSAYGPLNNPANAISSLRVQAETLLGVQAALNALNTIPSCASLFEGVGFTPNPATVLSDIWNNTGYGSFSFSYIPDGTNPNTGAINEWTNAQTGGSGYVGLGPGGLPQYTSATITMNTNASTPLNFSGGVQNWEVTILHELGHVYQMLFGQSSTQILYDGPNSPAGTSQANTALVMKNCLQ